MQRNNYSKNAIRKKRQYLQSRSAQRWHALSVFVMTLLLVLMLGFAGISIALLAGTYRGIIDAAPAIQSISVVPTKYSTFIYDIEGNQIAKLVASDSNRIPVSDDMVPQNLKDAFVAIEDERFYEHHGIDVQGIMRAGFEVIKNKDFSQGASTITQQLIKNTVFTDFTHESRAESIKRKLQEQRLAIELEKKMSKDEILLNYMNTINLGHNTLGVQAASLRYFGKPVSQLSLSECATIACITQNPSAYDPIVYPENNKKRKDVVLEKMLEQGYISQVEYETAIHDNVYARIQETDTRTDDNAVQSYFVDALTKQILADLQKAGYSEQDAYTLLYTGGLSVYATQDPKLQKKIDDIVTNEEIYPDGTTWALDYALTVLRNGTERTYNEYDVEKYMKSAGLNYNIEHFPDKETIETVLEDFRTTYVDRNEKTVKETVYCIPQPQISLTLEDQSTGYVLAMVGGRGDKKANLTLNRATDTMRQPGSTFKVLSTYAPALDTGKKTLASTIVDEPFTYKDGTPVKNWYASYRGPCTLRDGIRDSLNVVTVKLLTEITPEVGFEYVEDFGITTLVRNETIDGQIFTDVKQPLALGGITKGVTNLELNGAYAAIANEGVYKEPKLYTRILDHDGNVILSAEKTQQTHAAVSPQTAWLLTSAMQDVIERGTGTAVQFQLTKDDVTYTMPLAGKTGTTEKNNDVWFAGYSPYYTMTTWAGYDDNTKLGTSAEIALAKTIWRECMKAVHEGLEAKEFEMPDGIEKIKVCALSGLPASGSSCPIREEYIDTRHLGDKTCDMHYTGEICTYSGLPASDACPFKTTGTLSLTESGKKCEHTAEFMAGEHAAETIAAQQAELNVRQAKEQQQAALDAVVLEHQQDAANLKLIQDTYLAAQAQGNSEMAAKLKEQMTAAETKYFDSLNRMQALAQQVGQ